MILSQTSQAQLLSARLEEEIISVPLPCPRYVGRDSDFCQDPDDASIALHTQVFLSAYTVEEEKGQPLVFFTVVNNECLECGADFDKETVESAAIEHLLEMFGIEAMVSCGIGSGGSGGSGSNSSGFDIKAFVAQHPKKSGEGHYQWTSRIVQGLSPEVKHEVLFATREQYAPVDIIAEGATRWRRMQGLPEPQVDITQIKAPFEKCDTVGKLFEVSDDQRNDPQVQAAFADFKRQNQEMFDFITRPQSQGGLGIEVEIVDTPTDEPYADARQQAADILKHRRFKVETGLGGKHSLLTTEEYDRFRAVHDIFGHAGIGGGFDRHGEYQAWLVHMSMYTGLGRMAMASEYHGVNTASWGGQPGTPGAGKSILLPDELILCPWDESGVLVRA